MDQWQRDERRAQVINVLVIGLIVVVVVGLMIAGAVNGPRLD